jgi:hypothetical protein
MVCPLPPLVLRLGMLPSGLNSCVRVSINSLFPLEKVSFILCFPLSKSFRMCNTLSSSLSFLSSLWSPMFPASSSSDISAEGCPPCPHLLVIQSSTCWQYQSSNTTVKYLGFSRLKKKEFKSTCKQVILTVPTVPSP